MVDFRQFLELIDPQLQQRFDKVVTPAEFVNLFHSSDDKDTSGLSSHHTLGLGHTQSAYGDHDHDGKNSKLLFEAAQLRQAKSGATTTSSDTTLSNDPDLQITVEAKTLYAMVLFMYITSPATADFKWDLTVPTGTIVRGILFNGNTAVMDKFSEATFPQTNSTSGGTGGNADPVLAVAGIRTDTSSGKIIHRWAQAVSDVGSTILKESSFIFLSKMKSYV